MGVPVLGSVARFDRAAVKAGRNLIINCHPTEPIAEMYHAIRTNMLALNGPNPTFLIASPEQGDGKSMTTANLAISMAMANLRVLLIDADLRRPSLHEIFGLENRTGLSTLLLQARNDQFDIQEETAARLVLQQCLQATGIPNLSIITSGPAPAQSPSTMLGSSLMQAWLAVFQQASSVDVVLIDTPPSLVVPDSIALAAAIHAVSVLVVDSGRTRREAALRAKQQFDQVGKPLAGVIVNRVRRMDDEYYSYGYEYGKLPAKRGGPFKRLIG
jgi:capsular exopolysaccharide synthesis family protein